MQKTSHLAHRSDRWSQYYSDKPETCRSCFFWKNRKVPCILGQEKLLLFSGNHSIRAAEEMRGCYASSRSCVSATCYKDLMMQFNASKNKES